MADVFDHSIASVLAFSIFTSVIFFATAPVVLRFGSICRGFAIKLLCLELERKGRFGIKFKAYNFANFSRA